MAKRRKKGQARTQESEGSNVTLAGSGNPRSRTGGRKRRRLTLEKGDASTIVAGSPEDELRHPRSGVSGFPKQKRIWREAMPSKAGPNGFHNFDVDPLDHAETDINAYRHLKPCLELLARHLSKQPAKLKIWDPYFCKGSIVKRLAELGFPKVHNVNEDCYALMESGNVPDHDVLVSSPPYSGDHLERCIQFCSKSTKAWCLLLPNWVASRPYFAKALGQNSKQLFFISPIRRYTYWMPPDLVKGHSKPEWVGADGGTSPYDSTWFVYTTQGHKKIFEALEKHPCAKKDWVLARTMKAARWKVKKAREVGSMDIGAGLADHGTQRMQLATKGGAKRGKGSKKERKKESQKWAGTVCFN